MSLRIGTAAWSIPSALRDAFPPGPSILARYAQVLNCVEINTSFYRPHRRATYQRWAATTPPDFRFAVKVPQTITHEKRLIGAGAALTQFLDEVSGLAEKLGPLLVQLPPSLAFDARSAGGFFADVHARSSTRMVCEPRHPTWFSDEADGFLREAGIARVAADPAPVPAAADFGGWQGLHYRRLHGSPRIYYSDYGPDRLASIATDLSGRIMETWCVFDNTALGHATANALDLKRRIARR